MAKHQIADFVAVRKQPTVIRLDVLAEDEADWISESYVLTEEATRHITVIRNILDRPHGCGVFLIGHYGSGKSHFLAYLAQQVAAQSLARCHPVTLSLLNFSADRTLESIITGVLELEAGAPDRRITFAALNERFPDGLLLIIDELSEFLRSKRDHRAFNEDIRFLQFLGEWAQDQPFWLVAALQEQIEHTGEMEYDLFRKIKDRYPTRLILTTTHVKDLIARRLLIKKDGYQDAVTKLAGQLKRAFPGNPIDFEDFVNIYPLHPATLILLEEVRDRFSQARGIIGFTMTRLGGDAATGVEPFLEREWGSLLSPDTIVDHFQDLFEVQPEFLPLAQKVLPWYRKNMNRLFPKDALRALAERVLQLLVLVHLSPARSVLHVREAAWWLLYKVSTIQPEKNIDVLQKILTGMATEGAWIKQDAGGYCIDLQEDSRQTLDQLIEKTINEMGQVGETVLESLTALLGDKGFNPFTLDRERWQKHILRWHFHDRELMVWFGGGDPKCPSKPGLQIGLPWGKPPEGRGCARLTPKAIPVTHELIELAALNQLSQRPLPARVLERVRERITARISLFAAQISEAYHQAMLVDEMGHAQHNTAIHQNDTLKEWLRKHGELLFRRTWPQFESYAPVHGPLPRDAYRQLLDFTRENDLEDEDAPDFVRLIREAYLAPMGLMVRKGRRYALSPKLDQHELVGLVRPMLDHQLTPKRMLQHFATPVYGLVPDQVNLLLLVLMLQGEVDLIKNRKSIKTLYETFPLPSDYDRVIKKEVLNMSQLHDLEMVCKGLGISLGQSANVLAQRRCAQQLQRMGAKERDRLSHFAAKLRDMGMEELVGKIDNHLQVWASIEKGEDALQGLQLFLFALSSPGRFLEVHGELATLPQRLEGLIKETRRFQHLLANPVITASPNPKIRIALENMDEPPGLDETDALSHWLAGAARVYEEYKYWYRERHDSWWHELSGHPIWQYRPSELVNSHHLGLKETWQELQSSRERLRASFCKGLTDLEYQSACVCGFDGEKASLDINRLIGLRDEIDQGLARFFQRDEVKAKVRDWTEKGVETNQQTLAYLQGGSDLPRVADLNMFDQHLAGIALYRDAGTEPIINLLCERIWDRDRLMDALGGMIRRLGPRISFTPPQPRENRSDLVAWCLEAALRTAKPLPPGFSKNELAEIPDMIRPEWLSGRTLQHLDELGLGEAAENRILQMVLDGTIPLHETMARDGLPAALQALSGLPDIDSPEDMAHWVAVLYRRHHRFIKLSKQTWLTRMDELANNSFHKPVPLLQDVLKEHLEPQWLIIDCLGLPLWHLFERHFRDWLARWKWQSTSFALAPRKTDTEAFYQSLAEHNIQKVFHKRNVVDNLIHQYQGPFEDLEKKAATELEITFRSLRDLDPAKPLLLFADHGFRLERDGMRYVHGGSSVLERLTPVVLMTPFT